jgi:DNA-binding NarL/FixJ family response regulator
MNYRKKNMNVLIADDLQLMRQYLINIICKDGDLKNIGITGQAAEVSGSIKDISPIKPDVVIPGIPIRGGGLYYAL